MKLFAMCFVALTCGCSTFGTHSQNRVPASSDAAAKEQVVVLPVEYKNGITRNINFMPIDFYVANSDFFIVGIKHEEPPTDFEAQSAAYYNLSQWMVLKRDAEGKWLVLDQYTNKSVPESSSRPIRIRRTKPNQLEVHGFCRDTNGVTPVIRESLDNGMTWKSKLGPS